MAMRWLLGRFARNYDEQTMKPEENAMAFHRFPDLPTELRLQIWEYYFDVPRIHVLYRGSSKSPRGPGETPLAYADLTARTNSNMPASRRFAAAAINHEALEVFQKAFDFVDVNFMSLPSKHVRDLFAGAASTGDPDHRRSTPPNHRRPSPGLAASVQNPGGKPRDTTVPGIHINWERDLLYLADGADVNCETLRRACHGPLAGRLRRVAILIHDGCGYAGWRPFYGPSADFPRPAAAKPAEVVLVVRLGDPDPSSCAAVERDEFGFAPYDAVVRGQKEGTWEWMQNMKLIERRFVYVAQVLREAFPDLADQEIKWAVDVDYIHHKAEMQYSRTPR
ncbi:hypothetical protein F4802DRAFT_335062 [Xylaria palmicola]|nr:hypothetical protein F4802DRAFT_335062 [Xylaria palmicola]